MEQHIQLTDYVKTLKASIDYPCYGSYHQSLQDQMDTQISLMDELKCIQGHDGSKQVADLQLELQKAIQSTVAVQDNLEYMAGVTNLQDLLSDFSEIITKRSVNLSMKELNINQYEKDISSVLENCWEHVREFSTLIQFHVNNAAHYHQFYHRCKQFEHDSHKSLATIAEYLFEGDQLDPRLFNRILKESHNKLLLLGDELQQLQDKVINVAPIYQRIKAMNTRKEMEAMFLTAYRTEKFYFFRNEKVKVIQMGKPLTDDTDQESDQDTVCFPTLSLTQRTLSTNSMSSYWMVQSLDGQRTGYVPSICLWTPGPDDESLLVVKAIKKAFISEWRDTIDSLLNHSLHLFSTFLDRITESKSITLKQETMLKRFFDELEYCLTGSSEAKDAVGNKALLTKIAIIRSLIVENIIVVEQNSDLKTSEISCYEQILSRIKDHMMTARLFETDQSEIFKREKELEVLRRESLAKMEAAAKLIEITNRKWLRLDRKISKMEKTAQERLSQWKTEQENWEPLESREENHAISARWFDSLYDHQLIDEKTKDVIEVDDMSDYSLEEFSSFRRRFRTEIREQEVAKPRKIALITHDKIMQVEMPLTEEQRYVTTKRIELAGVEEQRTSRQVTIKREEWSEEIREEEFEAIYGKNVEYASEWLDAPDGQAKIATREAFTTMEVALTVDEGMQTWLPVRRRTLDQMEPIELREALVFSFETDERNRPMVDAALDAVSLQPIKERAVDAGRMESRDQLIQTLEKNVKECAIQSDAIECITAEKAVVAKWANKDQEVLAKTITSNVLSQTRTLGQLIDCCASKIDNMKNKETQKVSPISASFTQTQLNQVHDMETISSHCKPKCRDSYCQALVLKAPQVETSLEYVKITKDQASVADLRRSMADNATEIETDRADFVDSAEQTSSKIVRHCASQNDMVEPITSEKSVSAVTHMRDAAGNTDDEPIVMQQQKDLQFSEKTVDQVDYSSSSMKTCTDTIEFASQYEPAAIGTNTASLQCKPKCRDSHCQTRVVQPIKTFEVSCATETDINQMASSYAYTKVSHLATDAAPLMKEEFCQHSIAGQETRNALAYSFEAEPGIETQDSTVQTVEFQVESSSKYTIKTMNQSSTAVRKRPTADLGVEAQVSLPVLEASVETQGVDLVDSGEQSQCMNVRHSANQMETLASHSLEKSVLALVQAIDGFTNTDLIGSKCDAQVSAFPVTGEMSMQTKLAIVEFASSQTEANVPQTFEFACQYSPMTVEYLAASVTCKPKCRDSHCQTKASTSDMLCGTELIERDPCHTASSFVFTETFEKSSIYSPDKRDVTCQSSPPQRIRESVSTSTDPEIKPTVKDAFVLSEPQEPTLQNFASQTEGSQIETASKFSIAAKEEATTLVPRKLDHDISIQAECTKPLREMFVKSHSLLLIDSSEQTELKNHRNLASQTNMINIDESVLVVTDMVDGTSNTEKISIKDALVYGRPKTQELSIQASICEKLIDCSSAVAIKPKNKHVQLGSFVCSGSTQTVVNQMEIREFSSQYDPAPPEMVAVSVQFKAKSRDSHCHAVIETTKKDRSGQTQPTNTRDCATRYATIGPELLDKSVIAVANTINATSNTEEEPIVEEAEFSIQTDAPMKLIDCYSSYHKIMQDHHVQNMPKSREFSSQSKSHTENSVAVQCRPKCRESYCQAIAEVMKTDQCQLILPISTDKNVQAVTPTFDAASFTDEQPIVETANKEIQNSVSTAVEDLCTQTALPIKLVECLTTWENSTKKQEYASQSDYQNVNSVSSQCKPKCRDSYCQALATKDQKVVKHCASQKDLIRPNLADKISSIELTLENQSCNTIERETREEYSTARPTTADCATEPTSQVELVDCSSSLQKGSKFKQAQTDVKSTRVTTQTHEIHARTLEFESQYQPVTVQMVSTLSQCKPKSKDSFCQVELTKPVAEIGCEADLLQRNLCITASSHAYTQNTSLSISCLATKEDKVCQQSPTKLLTSNVFTITDSEIKQQVKDALVSFIIQGPSMQHSMMQTIEEEVESQVETSSRYSTSSMDQASTVLESKSQTSRSLGTHITEPLQETASSAVLLLRDQREQTENLKLKSSAIQAVIAVSLQDVALNTEEMKTREVEISAKPCVEDSVTQLIPLLDVVDCSTVVLNSTADKLLQRRISTSVASAQTEEKTPKFSEISIQFNPVGFEMATVSSHFGAEQVDNYCQTAGSNRRDIDCETEFSETCLFVSSHACTKVQESGQQSKEKSLTNFSTMTESLDQVSTKEKHVHAKPDESEASVQTLEMKIDHLVEIATMYANPVISQAVMTSKKKAIKDVTVEVKIVAPLQDKSCGTLAVEFGDQEEQNRYRKTEVFAGQTNMVEQMTTEQSVLAVVHSVDATSNTEKEPAIERSSQDSQTDLPIVQTECSSNFVKQSGTQMTQSTPKFRDSHCQACASVDQNDQSEQTLCKKMKDFESHCEIIGPSIAERSVLAVVNTVDATSNTEEEPIAEVLMQNEQNSVKLHLKEIFVQTDRPVVQNDGYSSFSVSVKQTVDCSSQYECLITNTVSLQCKAKSKDLHCQTMEEIGRKDQVAQTLCKSFNNCASQMDATGPSVQSSQTITEPAQDTRDIQSSVFLSTEEKALEANRSVKSVDCSTGLFRSMESSETQHQVKNSQGATQTILVTKEISTQNRSLKSEDFTCQFHLQTAMTNQAQQTARTSLNNFAVQSDVLTPCTAEKSVFIAAKSQEMSTCTEMEETVDVPVQTEHLIQAVDCYSGLLTTASNRHCQDEMRTGESTTQTYIEKHEFSSQYEPLELTNFICQTTLDKTAKMKTVALETEAPFSLKSEATFSYVDASNISTECVVASREESCQHAFSHKEMVDAQIITEQESKHDHADALVYFYNDEPQSQDCEMQTQVTSQLEVKSQYRIAQMEKSVDVLKQKPLKYIGVEACICRPVMEATTETEKLDFMDKMEQTLDKIIRECAIQVDEIRPIMMEKSVLAAVNSSNAMCNTEDEPIIEELVKYVQLLTPPSLEEFWTQTEMPVAQVDCSTSVGKSLKNSLVQRNAQITREFATQSEAYAINSVSSQNKPTCRDSYCQAAMNIEQKDQADQTITKNVEHSATQCDVAFPKICEAASSTDPEPEKQAVQLQASPVVQDLLIQTDSPVVLVDCSVGLKTPKGNKQVQKDVKMSSSSIQKDTQHSPTSEFTNQFAVAVAETFEAASQNQIKCRESESQTVQIPQASKTDTCCETDLIVGKLSIPASSFMYREEKTKATQIHKNTKDECCEITQHEKSLFNSQTMTEWKSEVREASSFYFARKNCVESVLVQTELEDQLEASSKQSISICDQATNAVRKPLMTNIGTECERFVMDSTTETNVNLIDETQQTKAKKFKECDSQSDFIGFSHKSTLVRAEVQDGSTYIEDEPNQEPQVQELAIIAKPSTQDVFAQVAIGEKALDCFSAVITNSEHKQHQRHVHTSVETNQTDLLQSQTIEFSSQYQPSPLEVASVSLQCRPKCNDSHSQVELKTSEVACEAAIRKEQPCRTNSSHFYRDVSSLSTSFSPHMKEGSCQQSVLQKATSAGYTMTESEKQQETRDALAYSFESSSIDVTVQTEQHQVEAYSKYETKTIDKSLTALREKSVANSGIEAHVSVPVLEVSVETHGVDLVDSGEQSVFTNVKHSANQKETLRSQSLDKSVLACASTLDGSTNTGVKISPVMDEVSSQTEIRLPHTVEFSSQYSLAPIQQASISILCKSKCVDSHCQTIEVPRTETLEIACDTDSQGLHLHHIASSFVYAGALDISTGCSPDEISQSTVPTIIAVNSSTEMKSEMKEALIYTHALEHKDKVQQTIGKNATDCASQSDLIRPTNTDKSVLAVAHTANADLNTEEEHKHDVQLAARPFVDALCTQTELPVDQIDYYSAASRRHVDVFIQESLEKSTHEYASQYGPVAIDKETASIQCKPINRDSHSQTIIPPSIETFEISCETDRDSYQMASSFIYTELSDLATECVTAKESKLSMTDFQQLTCEEALVYSLEPSYQIETSSRYTQMMMNQATTTIRPTNNVLVQVDYKPSVKKTEAKDESMQTNQKQAIDMANQSNEAADSQDSGTNTTKKETRNIQLLVIPDKEDFGTQKDLEQKPQNTQVNTQTMIADLNICRTASSFLYTERTTETKEEGCQVAESQRIRDALCYSYDGDTIETIHQILTAPNDLALEAPSTRFTRLTDELPEDSPDQSPDDHHSTLHSNVFSTGSSTTSMDFEWQETDLPLVFDESLHKEFSTQTDIPDSPSNINFQASGFRDIVTSLNNAEKKGLYKILCQAFDRSSSQDVAEHIFLNNFLNELISNSPDQLDSGETFTSEIGINVCTLPSTKSQAVTTDLLPDAWETNVHPLSRYNDLYKMGAIVECESQTNPFVQHSVSVQSENLFSDVTCQTCVFYYDSASQTIPTQEVAAQQIDVDCEIQLNLDDLIQEQVSVSYQAPTPDNYAVTSTVQPSLFIANSSDQIKITVNCRQLTYHIVEHVMPSSTIFLEDIASVYNPISRTFINTEQSIGQGLLKVSDTIGYFDRSSKSIISLEHALLLGRLKLKNITFTRASPERRKVGLFLIEKEDIVKRSALLDYVIDVQTGQKIPARVAMRDGLIVKDSRSCKVLDTQRGSYLNVEEAIGLGLVQVSEPSGSSQRQDIRLRSLVKLFHLTAVSANGMDFYDLEEAMRLGYFDWQSGQVVKLHEDNVKSWHSLLDSLKEGRVKMAEAVGLSLTDIKNNPREILNRTDLISFEETSLTSERSAGTQQRGEAERRRYFCYEKHVLKRVTQRYTEEHVFEASEFRLLK